MTLDWIDVTGLSFNAVLVLERVQHSWMPGYAPEQELATALRANPAVEWYLRHKCPQINPRLDQVGYFTSNGCARQYFTYRVA
jgi:hypothetical protein